MAFTVPNAPAARRLYDTAKRVRDELGKGQEILRTAPVSINGVNAVDIRALLIIPDVDIVVVGVRLVGGGGVLAADTAEVLALADGEDLTTAAGATNRLVASVTDPSTADDIVLDVALLGLNGNVVQAGQPVVASFTDAALVANTFLCFQLSYILADAVTSYTSG